MKKSKKTLGLIAGLLSAFSAFAGNDPASEFVFLSARTHRPILCQPISRPRSENPSSIEYQLFLEARNVTLLVYEDRVSRDWYRYSPNSGFEYVGGRSGGDSSETEPYRLTDRATRVNLDSDGTPELVGVDPETHRVELCRLGR